MGATRFALDHDCLFALVDDGDLAIAAPDGIEQNGLVERFGIPQAGGYKRRRVVAHLSIVGAAQAITVDLKGDPTRLSVVVAARGETHETAVHPVRFWLIREAIEGNAEEGNHDLSMRANRQLTIIPDELDGGEPDFAAVTVDLVVEATGRREAGKR